jgi:hypothetical protein
MKLERSATNRFARTDGHLIALKSMVGFAIVLNVAILVGVFVH